MSKATGWRQCLWMAPLTIALGSPAANAQAPEADELALDEIVVTARKREESLIEVPLAVTAVTADQIEREGIKDVSAIMQRDPSLNFDQGIGPADTRIVIRGLSPTRGRPNVATLVDGIDVSSEASGIAGGSLLINPRLIDIAQIEVVKGPQSALYGRSAFSGAVSYTTADPADSVQGSLQVEASDRSQTELKANISLPLTDTLGLRLSGYRFKDGGYYVNSVSGNKVGGGDGKGGALTLKWDPNEIYSLKLRSEYSDDFFDAPAQVVLPVNASGRVPANASVCNIGTNAMGAPISIGFVIDATCPLTDPNVITLGLYAYRELERLTGNLGKFDDMSIPQFRGGIGSGRNLSVAYNPDYTQSTDNGLTAPDYPGSNRQVLRLSAVQNLDFSFGRFTSLTGYTRALASTDFDIDKTAYLPIQQNLKTDNTTEQFSQELRFTSDFDGPINFFAGLQYWTERSDQLERNFGAVVGEGTVCFAVDPPGPAPTVQAPAGPAGPLLVPANSCTTGGGFSSASVAPFMDDVYRARLPNWVRRTIDHKSAYLDIEWQIIESLKLIAEARWVEEENFVSGGYTDGSNGPGTVILCGLNGPCLGGAGIPAMGYLPFPVTGQFATLSPRGFAPVPVTRQIDYPVLKEDYVTPKVTLQWSPNRDLNVFLSAAEARKPGGYSTVTLGGSGAPLDPADILFEAEKLRAYELGLKWRDASGRLLLTSSLFKTDFTDKQVGSQVIVGNTLTNRVTNAGKAELQGIEFATQWRAAANWTMGFGATYFSKYEYTDYRTTTTGAGVIARVGNCTVGYLEAGTNRFVALSGGVRPNNPATNAPYSLTCLVDYTGRKLEDTPELSIAGNVGYRRPLANGTSFFADVDAKWEDQRFLEDDNIAYLNSYWLANLRLGLEGERWTAVLFVDNIADNRTIRSAGTGPNLPGSDFRLGSFSWFPGPGAPSQILVAAPSIPTTTFVTLPNPRTAGLRFSYKF